MRACRPNSANREFVPMDHQLPLPTPESGPFERLRESLRRAYSDDGVERPPLVWNDIPPAPPQPQAESGQREVVYDRRGDQRAKMSVYRSARLRWKGREGLCLIRNLSTGGMMCRSLAKPAKGDRVEVEMRSGDVVAGSVMWAKDGQFGVQFDHAVDVASLLNPRTPSHGLVQRMPRLAAGCAARLTTDDGQQEVTLLDVSQGGAKIEAADLREGDVVTLAVPGLDMRRGDVRWAHDGLVGIAFYNPLPFESLARWAVERPLN